MINLLQLSKRVRIGFIVIAGMFLLTACPSESGNELDTSLFVKNNLNDTLDLRFFGKNLLLEKDSMLTTDDVDRIYNFLQNSSLILQLEPTEIRELENNLSSETIIESPIGEHFYLINIDTLLEYSPETWDRKSGMKHYYLFYLTDYELISYTLEYP